MYFNALDAPPQARGVLDETDLRVPGIPGGVRVVDEPCWEIERSHTPVQVDPEGVAFGQTPGNHQRNELHVHVSVQLAQALRLQHNGWSHSWHRVHWRDPPTHRLWCIVEPIITDRPDPMPFHGLAYALMALCAGV